jgi:PAS domain S-box-containing protein
VNRGERPPLKTLATTFIRPDGTRVPVAICLGHVPLGDGRAVLGFVRDLSEQTTIQAALRASEDRFRTVAHASPDSIAIYVDGKCVYANPKALTLYELSSDDIASFEPMERVPPEHRAAVATYVERIRGGELLPPLASRRTSKNGDVRDMESTMSATSLDGKQAILVFTRDVTERQRVQAELIKQDRLASLGVLAAGVAHELNNPLTALSLIVGRLRNATTENVPGRELGADLEQVDDAVKRMSAIIGDLLFLARPADQPHAHVDIAKVVESSVALLRAGIPRCPAITVDVGDLPPVNGVPSKLGQAVVNVLRNAIQACGPDGEVVVSARAAAGKVVVVIEDNGGGIPEHVLPRLMTPFFTTKENGTGLGLWITQGIMQSHGGRLEIASTVGVGTKVTLALPA